MNYLYFFKYIYTITNNYDLQLLIYDIIKTKQLKDKIHIEMNSYFIKIKKKSQNILMLYLLPNIFLFKNFTKVNNIKSLIRSNEISFINTINKRAFMTLDRRYIFENTYVKEIINNNVIVHPFFMNIIIDRLLFNYPYRDYKYNLGVYYSNCVQLEKNRIMYYKLHYTKLISV